MSVTLRRAAAEGGRFVAACSGLGDGREVRVIADSANEYTVISLGAVRALVALARDIQDTADLFTAEQVEEALRA